METTITSIVQTTDYRTFLALAAATGFHHLGLGRAIVRILCLLPSAIAVIFAEGMHLAPESLLCCQHDNKKDRAHAHLVFVLRETFLCNRFV